MASDPLFFVTVEDQLLAPVSALLVFFLPLARPPPSPLLMPLQLRNALKFCGRKEPSPSRLLHTRKLPTVTN